MRRLLLLPLFLVPVVLALPAAADDKKDEKWVQLFNGKDLTGWKLHPKCNPAFTEIITKMDGDKVTGLAQLVDRSVVLQDANFTELKQDIKQLSDGITDSYKSIGDTFVATWDDIKATLATKEDITKVETRLDRIETRLESTATKDDIAGIKATQDLILQLLQQKTPES